MLQIMESKKKLTEFCTLPSKPLEILREYLAKRGVDVNLRQLMSIINNDYQAAVVDNTCRVEGSSFIFPIRFSKSDGKPIELSLRKSSCKPGYMFLYYVSLESTEKNLEPSQHFERFAFLGNWASYLAELATIAAFEPWDFQDGYQTKPFDILAQYLKYTFYHLEREDKIMYADDGMLAAFNTGLVDAHYNDIYAFFIPNSGITKWKAAGFGTAASRGLGKPLINFFAALPERACYIHALTDLTLCASYKVFVDWEHIILDNLDRLPLGFLSSCWAGDKDAQNLLNSVFSNIDVLENKCRLKELVAKSEGLFLSLQEWLSVALNYSLKLLASNYRIAIPSYYPRGDKTALLLPLYLQNKEHPDVAIVVENLSSGRCQGHTILTLQQAYVDARVISTLRGTWLEGIPALKGG